MKTLFALLVSAMLFFPKADELVTNSNFATGTFTGWYTCFYSAGDTAVIEETSNGNIVHFTLNDGGKETRDVMLLQKIALRAGFRYSISIQGVGSTSEYSKDLYFGLSHNGGAGQGGDGSGDYTSYVRKTGRFPGGEYKQFSTVWNDTDVNDDNVRVYIEGGGDTIDFSITWVSVLETPLPQNPDARFTQAGFYRNGSKRMVVKGAIGSSFEIRDNAGTSVHTGTLGAETTWDPSGETVRIADFSGFTTVGTYSLYVGDRRKSENFTIAEHPLAALGNASLKAYYYQRASTELLSKYAGVWSRDKGHPDDRIIIYDSPGSDYISAPKGWYDAGDYGKYIVSSGITVYTLLALYTHFPGYFASLSLNIPESSNSTPDILDEVRWNLEWMLAMQTTDGGVYSKLTSLKFEPGFMPEWCGADRYVFMRTTPATLDFAAVMAQSSRVYQPFDKTFAAKCLTAAKKAYAWAQENPDVKYKQPADCETGEYGDSRLNDERFLASVELAVATGDTATYSYHTDNPLPPTTIPNWQTVSTLGLYTIVTFPDSFPAALVDSAAAEIVAMADSLATMQNSGYGISMSTGDFIWGSNSVAASQGIHMLYAYYLTGNEKYRAGAEQQIDYLLGRNPLATCFVTGFGTRSPLHPHHYISESDDITPPVPGLMAGGPNRNGEDTAYCEDYITEPAVSWLDKYCSYASNEVAINWNAPLAYLVNALEALHGGNGVSGFGRTTTGTVHNKSEPVKTPFTITASGPFLRIVLPDDVMVRQGPLTCHIYTMQGRQVAVFAGNDFHPGADRRQLLSIRRPEIGAGYFIAEVRSVDVTVRKGFVIR